MAPAAPPNAAARFSTRRKFSAFPSPRPPLTITLASSSEGPSLCTSTRSRILIFCDSALSEIFNVSTSAVLPSCRSTENALGRVNTIPVPCLGKVAVTTFSPPQGTVTCKVSPSNCRSVASVIRPILLRTSRRAAISRKSYVVAKSKSAGWCCFSNSLIVSTAGSVR